MENYPFTHCLHPNKIVNPYTQESLVVPCGKCEACRMSKSSRMALQCELEAATSNLVLFGTLTYAEEFIPTFTVEFSEECTSLGNFVWKSHFIDEDTGEEIEQFPYEDYQALYASCLDKLSAKQGYYRSSLRYRYLRKTDAQLFLKRLRFHFHKLFPNEKIRYYLCGEYGPLHFRPHFHFLLYLRFNDPTKRQEILSAVRESVYKAWRFGRIDLQVSRGACSHYVASYVSNFSTLPEIFKLRTFSPFCLHSQKLGYQFLQSQCKEVYGTPVDEFIRRSIQIDGNNKEFNLWRAYYSYFYPRCKGYALKSKLRRSLTYTMYRELQTFCRPFQRDEYQPTTPKFIVENMDYIFSLFSSAREMLSYYNDEFSLHKRYVDLFTMLAEEFPFGYDAFSKERERFRMSLYTQLLLSRHFYVSICNCKDHRVKHFLSLIDDFYSKLDYLHLREYFESQSKYFVEDYADPDDLIFFASGDYTPKYLCSPAYHRYKAMIREQYAKRMKHKKLNDANRIFFNDNTGELPF